MFLELYQFLSSETRNEPYFSSRERKIYKLYQHHIQIIYGPLNSRIYQAFLIIDLYNLGKRLKVQGAKHEDLQLCNLTGQFLAHGKFPPSARHWFTVNVSTEGNVELRPGSIYFRDLASQRLEHRGIRRKSRAKMGKKCLRRTQILFTAQAKGYAFKI